MTYIKKLLFSCLFASCILLTSCIPQRKLVLFQKSASDTLADSLYINQDYEFIIAPFDLLNLRVTSTVDPQSVAAFNPAAVGAGAAGGSGSYLQGTLVDKDGEIRIPFAGKIKVSGLTLAQATDTIRSRLSFYLQDVDKNLILSLKILNYNVNVLGEVGNPGVIASDNEYMTVTEVLAKAGGITDFGNRQNVKIIRTDRLTKKTTTYQMDLTTTETVAPILSRLQPGDVIYVEPLPRKRYSTAAQVVSLATTFVTIPLLLISVYNIIRSF